MTPRNFCAIKLKITPQLKLHHKIEIRQTVRVLKHSNERDFIKEIVFLKRMLSWGQLPNSMNFINVNGPQCQGHAQVRFVPTTFSLT